MLLDRCPHLHTLSLTGDLGYYGRTLISSLNGATWPLLRSLSLGKIPQAIWAFVPASVNQFDFAGFLSRHYSLEHLSVTDYSNYPRAPKLPHLRTFECVNFIPTTNCLFRYARSFGSITELTLSQTNHAMGGGHVQALCVALALLPLLESLNLTTGISGEMPYYHFSPILMSCPNLKRFTAKCWTTGPPFTNVSTTLLLASKCF